MREALMLVDPTAHPHVPHHRHFLDTAQRSTIVRMNDKVIEWLSGNVLASRAMFNSAFTLPLFFLPLPLKYQILLGLVSQSWIQWWGIPAIQRTQVKSDAKRDAIAEATYTALQNSAHVLDDQLVYLNDIHSFTEDTLDELRAAKIELQNVRGQVELANQQIMYRRYDTP